MNDTKYANAVGAVRAMEISLLGRNDMDQLIAAKTSAELSSLLAGKNRSGISQNTMDEVWEMLMSYAPDCSELKILLYKNDFHDLKAVLKAKISGRDPAHYIITPANVDADTINRAFTSKDYSILPKHLRSTAEEAYELATRTLDGQLSDSLIDAAALSELQKGAEVTGSDFMIRYAQLTAACADIKTAYRCSITMRSRQFMETAVCGTKGLDKNEMIKAALSGTDSLLSYLETTPYSEAAVRLRESPAKFEKWCDDVIMELAESARTKAFGAEPLAAYYIAKEAELKNLRILKVCKECGSDRETITERMRKLYV